jgi:hypothetical protein
MQHMALGPEQSDSAAVGRMTPHGSAPYQLYQLDCPAPEEWTQRLLALERKAFGKSGAWCVFGCEPRCLQPSLKECCLAYHSWSMSDM